MEGIRDRMLALSIDTEKNREKWRNMIKTRELGGVQIIADNAWESDFVKGYGIEGIPHFILLDPERNIITADAPRPSNDRIRDKFAELGL